MTPAVPFSDRLLACYFRRGWRGFHALMRACRRRTLRQPCRYGPVFDLRPTEYIDGVVLREGYYESEVFEALRPWLKPGAVFWDIGANFGLHAVTAAAHPGLHVCAFEPDPASARRLAAHAALNHASVQIHVGALGEHSGLAPLYVNTTGNPGMSTLTNPAIGPAITVATERADRLIGDQSLPSPTVVKLDVEGAEASVLRGFGDHLAVSSLRAVIFETDARVDTDPRRCPATTLLLDAGFRLRLLPRQESTSHLLANFAAERP